MAFIFSTSHLPETRVRRPDQREDEEDEDVMQPMPRAGGVRAFSHLPQPSLAQAYFPDALSTRPATPVGRPRPHTEPDDDHDTARPPEPDSVHEDDTRAHDEYADNTPWHSPRISTQDQPPQYRHAEPYAQEERDHPDPSNLRDASRPRDRGFSPSPQDLRDAFHAPAPDSPAREAPAQDSSPAQSQDRLLEKQLPPWAMTAAKSRPSNFFKNANIANAATSPVPSRFEASSGVIAQQGAQAQQNQGGQPAPQGPGTTPDGALQTANRVHLLDTTRPAKAPVKPEQPNKPKQTNWSQKADRIIKTPKDQFEAEKAAYEREKAAYPQKMAAYEREKAAYAMALATAAASQHTNNQNQKTLKAWENYDRAIQMMQNTPEGRKVLASLRDNTTRVFKVIMVNDPAKDSYRGKTIKPGALGQYVNTGMKDEQGRDVHVIFLSVHALARDAATPDGKTNADAEALEDVWHEFYHASERQAGNAIDPLGVGTSHVNDRVDPKQWPNAHEKRAVRFENIIRKRNGGTRIKTKYGGGYYLNKNNERIEIPAIDVNDPAPPLAPIS